jgi:hypothetical protein
MSTDDGQDIFDVKVLGEHVLYTVYMPRPDDPDIDDSNRASPETRIALHQQELIHLAVFPDTPVDGSGDAAAVNIRRHHLRLVVRRLQLSIHRLGRTVRRRHRFQRP